MRDSNPRLDALEACTLAAMLMAYIVQPPGFEPGVTSFRATRVARYTRAEGLLLVFQLLRYEQVAARCRRGESDSHAVRHTLLRRACLPFHHGGFQVLPVRLERTLFTLLRRMPLPYWAMRASGTGGAIRTLIDHGPKPCGYANSPTPAFRCSKQATILHPSP